jgi:hypothetical protein
MNHNVKQSVLTRIGRRIAAIAAECDYAQDRVGNLRNTPARF